jgi:hypothetical protein
MAKNPEIPTEYYGKWVEICERVENERKAITNETGGLTRKPVDSGARPVSQKRDDQGPSEQLQGKCPDVVDKPETVPKKKSKKKKRHKRCS